jgi:hypothetical protein
MAGGLKLVKGIIPLYTRKALFLTMAQRKGSFYFITAAITL